jgi:hypothetical protein
MAQQQTATAAVQPPPDLPNDPKLSDQTSHYLRNFALWCRQGFAGSLRAQTALPGLLLSAYDTPPGANPAVFMIQVASDGTIVATPVALGGKNPSP